MHKIGNNINLFLAVLLLGIFGACPFYEAEAACNKSCEQALNDCHPATQAGGKNFVRMSSSKISGKCLMDLSKDQCFNHVPTSFINNYSLTGSRWRWSQSGAARYGKRANTIYTGNNVSGDSAAGYIYLGNHLGADLGTGGRNNEVAYAAADGEVKLAECTSGSGKTIVIVHPMKCDGANGRSYSTVYRHMNALYVGKGEIKGGTKIGRIAGWGKCGDPNSYDPHLHFEVYDRGLNSGSSTGKQTEASTLKTILDSSCGGMQALCGGCPTDTKKCPQTSQPAGNAEAGSAAGGSDMSSDGASGGESSCSLINYLDSENCAFCGLFKVLFNSASSAAKIATDTLTVPSRNVISVAFLVWLAIYILKSFGTLTGTSPGDLLKGIISQGFRVALVAIILNGTVVYEAMDLTLNPVMQTGLNFANSLSGTKCDSGASYMQGIIGYDSGQYSKASKGGLSKNLGESIVCSIKHLEDQVSMLMALGKYSMCLGFGDEAWWNIIPHPGYIVTGVFLWLIGAILLLAFPWCLVDCVLQMCIAAAMIPCAIACFAFKSTQKYIMIVWNFFMNAMFNFVFMALIIYVINSIFKDLVGLPLDVGSYGNIENEAFITASSEAGKPALAAWGSCALKALGVCFLCWTFFDEAKDMASAFADSPSLGGRKGIGKMVGGTALGIADKGIARPAAKLGGKMASKAGHAIADSKAGKAMAAGYSHTMSAIRNKVTAAKAHSFKFMANHAFGGEGGNTIRDENGQAIGYRARFRAFGVEQERVFMKDENGHWSQQKDTHQRSGAEKAFEAVRDDSGAIDKISAFDQDGNEYKVNNIQARHRILGVETSLEDMTARIETRTDENGQDIKVVVYENADGSSRLVTDLDGKALRYKTNFTRSLKMEGFVPTFKADEQKAYSHRAYQTTGDAMIKDNSIVRGDGTVERSDVALRQHVASRLVNRDGSIDQDTYNEIMSKTKDTEAARLAMLNTVLKQRGEQALSSEFKDRQITTEKDGSFVVNMKMEDGSRRMISAHMEENRMIITDTKVDTNGNIYQRKDNGIQSVTKSFIKQNDGTYEAQSRHDFSNYAKNKSRSFVAHGAQVLSGQILGKSDDKNANFLNDRIQSALEGKPLQMKDGVKWDKDIDAADAMRGFTTKDFAEHLIQLQDGNDFNRLGAFRADGTLDEKLTKTDVMDILCEKRPAPEPKPEIVAPTEYSQAEITRMAKLDRKYENKTSMKDYIELDNYLDHQLDTAGHKAKNVQRKEKLNAQAHTYMQQAMKNELTDEARADISAHGQMFMDKFAKENGDTVVEQFGDWMEKNDLTPKPESADPLASFLDDALNMSSTGQKGQSDAQDSSFFGGSTPSTTTIDDLDRREAEIRHRDKQLREEQEYLEQKEKELREDQPKQ
ncbi:MAG: peptidoglycan DD-metalloendopeptidase family protein [Alphaproteobacteria bacterium]|nr:peptidoglycan DD-metalloendopeptidase family protein [Alphaproteobacteria bacterium]